jgi:hypothetical protein
MWPNRLYPRVLMSIPISGYTVLSKGLVGSYPLRRGVWGGVIEKCIFEIVSV